MKFLNFIIGRISVQENLHAGIVPIIIFYTKKQNVIENEKIIKNNK